MTTTKRLSVPVTGMTCTNCANTISRNLNRKDGVVEANVNYANERAEVIYDPTVINPAELTKAIEDVGYGVTEATVDLPIAGMTCTNCAMTIERNLKRMDGVLDVSVSYASELAHVRYLPTAVSLGDMKRKVSDVGYKVIEAEAGEGETAEDAEMKARTADLNDRKRRLTVGIVLTSIIMVLSMGHDFGLIPHFAARGWLLFALTIPVQFWVGWPFLSSAWKAAAKAHTANMDTLVAIGSLTAFIFSTIVLILGLDEHLYFESAAADRHADHGRQVPGSQGQDPGRRLDPQAAQPASQNRAHRPAGRRDRGTGRRGRGQRRGDRPPRREDTGGRRRAQRAVSRGREHGHRRKPAGGEGTGRCGDRRDHQPVGQLPLPRHQGRARHRPGADRAHGAGSARLQGADPAAGRQGRIDLRAGGADPGRADIPRLVRGRRRRLHRGDDVRRVGAADLLPLRAGAGRRRPR